MNKKLISAVLMVISFVWIFALVYRDKEGIGQIWSNLHSDNIHMLIDATIFVVIAVALLVPLVEIITRQNTQRVFPIRYLARLFFAGQVVSYLPGRLLGTAYLVNETQKIIPALTMVRLNVELILTIMLFNTLTAFSIMAYYLAGGMAALGSAVLGLGLFVVYHRMNLFDLLLQTTSKLLPKKFSEKLLKAKTHRPFEFKTIGLMIVIFTIHWAAYLKAWLCLKNAFVMLEGQAVFLLAAAYSISWFIGFITMVTPGGLGVREVSFVVLVSEYLPKQLASFLSLFLRIWLIVVDILLFLASYAVFKMFPCKIEPLPESGQ
ncbi:MAG: lysylphosphatidylglycerol synthase domain-containing protein [Candidatus Omnitrophota bacterium]